MTPTPSAKSFSDEQIEWLLGQIDLIDKLKKANNRKLLWLAMNTKPWKEQNLGSIEGEIFGEIENRLYPEYDGETVTFQEWGWRTPDGDVRYLPERLDKCQPPLHIQSFLPSSPAMESHKDGYEKAPHQTTQGRATLPDRQAVEQA